MNTIVKQITFDRDLTDSDTTRNATMQRIQAGASMTPQQPPETCSECDECLYSWHDSQWHCGDHPDDIGSGMILDIDIYTTVHRNCPLRRLQEK